MQSHTVDSSIAPFEIKNFLERTFHGCSTRRKDTIGKKKKYLYIFLCAKAYRSMTSGCRGTSCFRRHGRELVLKPAISLKKSWGGYRRTTLTRASDSQSHSTVYRGAANSENFLSSYHEGIAQHLTRVMVSKAFVRAPRPIFPCLSTKTMYS